MKTMTVTITGECPKYLRKSFELFDGEPCTAKNRHDINEEINFHVMDCQDAHGNLSSGGAWLAPRNGSNKWSIDIDQV
jgi:hypothetical protein